MTDLKRSCNAALERHTIRSGYRRCTGALGETVRAAESQNLSYGQYVARNETISLRSRRSKESGWTSPRRTIIEGLDSELITPESRAEWLDDPHAKQVLIAKRIRRKRL